MTRETITYKGLSIRDPAPYGEAGLAWQNNFIAIADTLDTLQGSLDTALGGLVIGTDIQAHSANLDTWSSIAPSADGQSLVAAVDYAAMRGLLGVRPGADVQGYSAALGAIAGLTPIDGSVIVGDGSTWVAESGATARASLGLGTLATQEAGDVAITGGEITGITDLAVADGGTGASDAAGARGNLGLGSIATQAANSVAITGGAINGTAIGATTPGAGTFTTLSATGTIGTPETTSSTIGVVNIGGLLIHGFRHPTGGTARPDGNNVFIGRLAGNFTMGADATSAAHASYNIGIGNNTLRALTTGYSNVALGGTALAAATTGYANMAIGYNALGTTTNGVHNIAIGYYAGRYIAAGDGYQPNRTTSNSVYIGTLTRASADGVTNEIVIGNSATGRGSNTVQIGNSAVTDTYLSGWLNLPSDTRGIKFDAAGTTTLTSDGTTATLSKPLKTAGYKASDGSAGISETITFKDADNVTHTLVFKDGLLTSHTEA